jgi:hypothetical protein
MRLDSVSYSGRLIMREMVAATMATAISDSTIGRPSIISITMMKAVSGAWVTAARNAVIPMAMMPVLTP